MSRNMLQIRRAGLFSSDYIVKENGAVVATLSRSRWRDRGEIAIQGESLRVRRKGAIKNTYVLERDEVVLAEVKREGLFRSRFVFEHHGYRYTIRRKAFSTVFKIKSNGHVAGTIKQKGFFFRGAVGELPEDWTLSIRVFVMWIALVRWKAADADTAVVAAGSLAD